MSSPTYSAAASERRGWALEQRSDAKTLVELNGRAHLQHLAPPVNREALLFGVSRDFLHRRRRRPRRALRASERRRSCPCPRCAPGCAGARGCRRARRTPRTRAVHAASSGLTSGTCRPRAQQLAAVVADVGDRPDRDDLACGARTAAADAADDAGNAWRSRSAARASPRERARPRRAGRSARGCRRCRAAQRRRGGGRSGAAQAPPRAWQRATRALVWRAWWLMSPRRTVLAEQDGDEQRSLAAANDRADRDRDGRGAVQRTVRGRRRHRDRAAARALAGLRRARGDRHLAGGDRLHRGVRQRRCRPRTATCELLDAAARSACPPSAAC